MRSTGRDNDIVPCFCMDCRCFQALGCWDMESDGAFGNEKGFVVHFMPVRRWARGLRREDKLAA